MQVAGRSLRPLTMPITDVTKPGQILILNGAPRSGKSSIVAVIQDTFDGPWMNLGVDVFVRAVTPKRYRPGMGLRPGEDDHEVAPLVPSLYAALYDSVAAHSRAGLNVVVDVGHHDAKILAECPSSCRIARPLRRSPLPDRSRHATAQRGSGRKGRRVRGRIRCGARPVAGRTLAECRPHPGDLRPRSRYVGPQSRAVRRDDPTTPRGWTAAVRLSAARGDLGDERLRPTIVLGTPYARALVLRRDTSTSFELDLAPR